MKTIFFDNDGTLVDTEKLYFQATAAVFRKMGVELTREWFVEDSLKKNARPWVLLEGLGLSVAEIDALRAERNELYNELLATGTELLPGVRDTLEKLHGKVQMAVVTTSLRKPFEIILAKTGIAPYFDFWVVNEDVQHEKPHPEPYLLAVELSKNSPENCMAIEDTERGLISAKEAGIACYVVPTELTKTHDFTRANGVLSGFAEILTLTSLQA